MALWKQVSRDPFARTELVRRQISIDHSIDRSCSWCGAVRHGRGGHKYLSIYATQSDGGRTSEHKGAFCCKSCHDSYHS